jgi:L-ribulose-5-phosphate 4-epimerase
MMLEATFGNASGFARRDGLIVIKPSGVPYDSLKPADMVITDLQGRTVHGALKPSSDLAAHLVLYRRFESIGGVVHTHSRFATAWAQAGREIPCLGTTHADYFHGPVPVTAPMQAEEVERDYEANTGEVIVRRFAHLDPARIPAALVWGHGPFCWGASAMAAVETASMLEEVARMAFLTVRLNPGVAPLPAHLHDRHFLRKHGPTAYYGQK